MEILTETDVIKNKIFNVFSFKLKTALFKIYNLISFNICMTIQINKSLSKEDILFLK